MTKQQHTLRKVDIMQFPPHIHLKILFKVTCIPLIRMRRTCSHMDSLVEEHKKKFEERADMGICVQFDISKKTKGIFEFRHNNVNNRTYMEATMMDPLEKFFSGVTMHQLSLCLATHSDHYEMQTARTILQRLKPICDIFSVFNAPIEIEVELSNFVKCRSVSIAEYTDLEQHLPNILSARNRSAISLRVSHAVEIVKHLKDLIFINSIFSHDEITEEQVHEILTTLTTIAIFGKAREFSISANMKPEDPLEEPTLIFPPTEILWSRKECDKFLPKYIRKLDLASGKCAVFSIMTYYKSIEICIINDTPEDILDFMIRTLRLEQRGFGMGHRYKYLAAHENERIHVIKKFV